MGNVSIKILKSSIPFEIVNSRICSPPTKPNIQTCEEKTVNSETERDE